MWLQPLELPGGGSAERLPVGTSGALCHVTGIQAVWVGLRGGDGGMRLVVASDHSGFEMKEFVKKVLGEMGLPWEDLGPDNGDEPVNYVEYALKAAKQVAAGSCDYGILVCNDGIGMSIVANKVAGIRCALCYSPYCAVIARQHNDANMLALGRIMDREAVRGMLINWFKTSFEGGRHRLRMEVLERYEKEHSRGAAE